MSKLLNIKSNRMIMRTNIYNLIKHSKSDSVAIIFVEQVFQVFSKVQRTAISLMFRCAALLFPQSNLMLQILWCAAPENTISNYLIFSKFPDSIFPQSPNHPITQSPNHPITQSPFLPFLHSRNSRISPISLLKSHNLTSII